MQRVSRIEFWEENGQTLTLGSKTPVCEALGLRNVFPGSQEGSFKENTAQNR